ncbi:MAG: isoprenylcysteine carboxyl methyltransferase family protein [Bacillota bacterium]
MFFYLFIIFIIIQRLTELAIARKNERWMKAKGAVEFGSGHYPIMVLLHSAFIITLIFEVLYFQRELSRFWFLLLVGFLFTQAMRIWALRSLGPYWNTKIIVLPGAKVVKKGPYQFIKHPNYVIVALEIILIPLLFNAYTTAVLFTMLNIMILSVRIPAEERALTEWTSYDTELEGHRRFLPLMKGEKNPSS